MEQIELEANLVNPFIRSALEFVTTMLGGTLERGKLDISDGNGERETMTAIISFTGQIKGDVALRVPKETAKTMVGRLLSMDVSGDEGAIIDGLSEIVNIVGGSAKGDLSTDTGETLKLSLPVVLCGSTYSVTSQENAHWLDIPFMSDMGNFAMLLRFDQV